MVFSLKNMLYIMGLKSTGSVKHRCGNFGMSNLVKCIKLKIVINVFQDKKYH